MRNLVKLRREAGHGAHVPRGWHMAWYAPGRRVGVYYPAPSHWILRALRELAYRVRLAIRAPSLERLEAVELQRSHRERQLMADQYADGYLVGWRECYQTCVEAFEEETSQSRELWDLGNLLAAAPKPTRSN